MAVIPGNIRGDFRPVGDDTTVFTADYYFGIDGASWKYLCQNQVHHLACNLFTVSPSSVLVGAGFYHPAFTYAFTETASGFNFNHSVYGDEATSNTSNYTWLGTGIFDSTGVNSSHSFLIQGYSAYGEGTSTSGFYIRWYQNIHWGTYATGTTLDSNFIAGKLTNKFLTGNKAITFNAVAASGEYIWYAYRAAGGTPSFSANDFNGGFQIAVTGTPFTNASGFTEQYQIWRSDYPSLGSVTVVVT